MMGVNSIGLEFGISKVALSGDGHVALVGNQQGSVYPLNGLVQDLYKKISWLLMMGPHTLEGVLL